MLDAKIIRNIENEMLAFYVQQRNRRGVDSNDTSFPKFSPDGLYHWYHTNYAEQGLGLAPYDKAVASFVDQNCRDFSRFVEIGAGLGQMSILLAAYGLPTTAIESSVKNFQDMELLASHVEDRLVLGLRRYLSTRNIWFPNGAEEYIDHGTLLFFTNLTFGIDDETHERMLDAIGNAGGVVLNLACFFRKRASPAEQQLLIEKVCSRGFDPPCKVYRWEKYEHRFPPGEIVFFRNSRSC